VTGELVLSCFPGIGILDMGFEEHGFCVVRGPDLLWGGDIKVFHPPAGVFDGVIGGPPCQAHSRLAALVRAKGATVAEDLIPEFARVVSEARPRWYLMENVRGAPSPAVVDYAEENFLVNNRWLGEEQSRLRRFYVGMLGPTPLGIRARLRVALFENPSFGFAVLAGHGPTPGFRDHHRPDSWQTLPEMLRLQGLPADFLEHAPLTLSGKRKVIGNAVALPMARELARAVREALDGAPREAVLSAMKGGRA